MTDEPVTFALAPNVSHDECAKLVTVLGETTVGPVTIDAARVQQLGGRAAQLLLIVQKVCQRDGRAFAIARPSKGFIDCATRLGLRDALLSESTSA